MEGIKEEVVLSPAHALSLIASGEGMSLCFIFIFFDVKGNLQPLPFGCAQGKTPAPMQ